VVISSHAFCPTAVERKPPISAAIASVTNTSIPNHFGCATTERNVSLGEVITPKKRAARPSGGAAAPVDAAELVIV
jgi:hypothetical protein